MESKKDREDRRRRAAIAKHQARVERLNANRPLSIITAQDGRNFIVSDAVLRENRVKLLELFDPNNNYMRWEDMERLVNRLGGTVEPVKGSHYKIMFHEHVKGYSDKLGVLVREHKGTYNELNLKLFRQAIAKTLPEGWETTLKAKCGYESPGNTL